MLANRKLAPDAVELLYAKDYILRIRFENGEVRDFDVEKQLLPRKCFVKLKDKRFFTKARIDYGTIVWGDELDVDPEWLYEESTPVNDCQ